MSKWISRSVLFCRARSSKAIPFPGTRAEWTVATYVRKVAFCRNPLPPPIHFANRVYGRLRRTFGLAPSAAPLLGAD